ncbi:hypothetical protein P5V15_006876 [Pogonomyrmex californicus]
MRVPRDKILRARWRGRTRITTSSQLSGSIGKPRSFFHFFFFFFFFSAEFAFLDVRSSRLEESRLAKRRGGADRISSVRVFATDDRLDDRSITALTFGQMINKCICDEITLRTTNPQNVKRGKRAEPSAIRGRARAIKSTIDVIQRIQRNALICA